MFEWTSARWIRYYNCVWRPETQTSLSSVSAFCSEIATALLSGCTKFRIYFCRSSRAPSVENTHAFYYATGEHWRWLKNRNNMSGCVCVCIKYDGEKSMSTHPSTTHVGMKEKYVFNIPILFGDIRRDIRIDTPTTPQHQQHQYSRTHSTGVRAHWLNSRDRHTA